MIQHIDWLTDLTSTVRKYSKVTVEDYIDRITTPGVPMDFVAITVLCRIYHIHVGVFFNNRAWSTCRDKHLKSSHFGIVFHGNLEFTETVHTGWTDKYHEWIVSRGQQGKMPSHTRTTMPGLLKTELLHSELPMEEEDDTVQDMQLDIKVKLPPKVECFVLDPVQKKIKIAKQTLLAKQKCELSEALSFATQPVMPTQPAVPTQSTVVSSTVQPKKQHRIGGDRLKGPQICPCCNCLEKSQTALNIHINQQHPDYMFPCTVCGKLYMSYNSRYKHQIEHTAPTFFCGECSEGFHFQAELTKHMNVHSAIKPFGCNLCQKRFTQQKSLTRHMKVHEDRTVTCPMCDKTCATPEQLYTHYRGAHGKGYDTPCGEHYQWPAHRARHQKACTKCKNYRELKKIKKRFPMPFKKENQDSVAVKQELRNE